MDQKKWDERFLKLASFYASWSKDPSRKVGAVLAHGKHQIGQGYNGFPTYVSDDPEVLADRKQKHGLMLHAERNAIYNCQQDTRGATLYSTLYPCNECAKTIVLSGIARVVYSKELENPSDGSIDYNTEATKKLFDACGIQVIHIEKVTE